MKLLRVFLVESSIVHAEHLKKKLLNIDTIRTVIPAAGRQNAEELFKDVAERVDVVIFGEKMAYPAIAQMARVFRSHDRLIPIFYIRRQSEARVPAKLQKAGVDDVLNSAEIDTPLFPWIFRSAIENAFHKKKAREYDSLSYRLNKSSESLAQLIHEINNPLSIIRLAMYHLEDPHLPIDKKDAFIKILIRSLDRIENHVNELRSIRRRLNGDSLQLPQFIALNLPVRATASR